MPQTTRHTLPADACRGSAHAPVTRRQAPGRQLLTVCCPQLAAPRPVAAGHINRAAINHNGGQHG